MMYYPMYFDPTYVLVLIGVVICMIASAKMNSTFNKYSRVRSHSGMTGREAAETILRRAGIYDVRVERISGNLTDHYDPSKKVLRLSSAVAEGDSIASVAVAAHEVGHALQHAQGYVPIKVRGAIIPVVNISSKLAWPAIIVGIIIEQTGRIYEGNIIFTIGIVLFAAVVAFHAVTLPVELNASRRALVQLESLGIVYPEEKRSAKKVLSAAAMTYLAALAAALMQLIRLLLIRGRD